MKRLLLLFMFVALLSVPLMGATPTPRPVGTRIVRFEVINKSGGEVGIELIGQVAEQFHWLTVEEGSRANPYTKTFTVWNDTYQVKVFTDSVLCWSQVENEEWVAIKYMTLDVTKNTRLVITPCHTPPPNLGDPPLRFYKWFLPVEWETAYRYQ